MVADKRKSKFEVAEKLVQEKYESLSVGLKALGSLHQLEGPLYQHLLKETVQEPFNAMLALRYEELIGTRVEVSVENRKQCLDKLVSKGIGSKVASLNQLFGALTVKPKPKLAESTPVDVPSPECEKEAAGRIDNDHKAKAKEGKG